MKASRRAWLTLVAGAMLLALLIAPVFVAAPKPSLTQQQVPGLRRDARAAAVAGLLDAPAGLPAVEEGLAIGEALRKLYGIDTGNLEADRLAAARRAQHEVLEPLRFTPEQLEQAARALGYSLDPAVCSNFCENVSRLAVVALHKQALKEFAAAHAAL